MENFITVFFSVFVSSVELSVVLNTAVATTDGALHGVAGMTCCWEQTAEPKDV